MSSRAPSRWAAAAMRKRVRRRYITERWFRGIGLAAVGLSVLFLAFLLFNMAAKGLGGFVHYEAAVPIDFTRSDLFLDPASLRGPDAGQIVASADLEGAISKASVAGFGPGTDEMFGDAAVNKLTKAIIADPDILQGPSTLWLPVGSKVDMAAKNRGDAASEKLVNILQSRHGLRRVFNTDFLIASDSTDPSSVGIWGALKGTFLTILVTI